MTRADWVLVGMGVLLLLAIVGMFIPIQTYTITP